MALPDLSQINILQNAGHISDETAAPSAPPPIPTAPGQLAMAPIGGAPAPDAGGPLPLPANDNFVEDREAVSEGRGIPAKGKLPTVQEKAMQLLGRPLTQMEFRDPELLKRLTDDKVRMGKVEDAQKRQRDAIEEGADIGMRRAAEEHAAQEKYRSLQLASAADFESNERVRQTEARKRDESLNREAEALAKEKVDGNRLFANQTTGDRIVAGIMTFFGAAGATRRGGAGRGNAYTNSINRAIDRDIEIQKANIANKKASLDAKRGLYADFLNMTKNEREAELLTKNKYLEIAKGMVEDKALKYKGEEAQNKAALALGELDEKIAFNEAERQRMIQERLAHERAAAAAQQAGRAKEERDHRWTLLQKDIDHQHKMEEEGAKNHNKGMTPEQRELHKAQVAGEATNKQFADMMKDPIITGNTTGAAALPLTSLGGAVGTAAGRRVFSDAAKDEQALAGMNQRVLQMLAAAAKDAEGKPGQAMLEELKHTFKLNASDSPELKQQKLQQVLDTLNGLTLREGASVPEPGPARGKEKGDNEQVSAAKKAGLQLE